MQIYETKEQCLAVDGEHAWGETEYRILYHLHSIHLPLGIEVSSEQYCSDCPARRVYRQVQEPKYSWIEE